MECDGEAVKAESGMEQVSIRVLLILVEGLGTSAHAAQGGGHAKPWNSRVF